MRTTEITDDILREPSRLLRSPCAYGIEFESGADAIVPVGGMFNAGLIRKAAVITKGEALGHGMWIDDTMLAQVADAVNNSKSGVKSRFTHPSMSGDGLGRAVGRYMNATNKGGIVRADLHILESSHETPDGDLGGYVMKLAAEDPEAFGNSISFAEDVGEMDRFRADNEDKDGRFVSPDKKNKNNYPHVRLAKLAAVDVVDEPAANPNGLFHRSYNLYANMDEFIGYVLGLKDTPAALEGMPECERVRAYVQRYLQANGLCIAKDKTEITRRIKRIALQARAQKEMYESLTTGKK